MKKLFVSTILAAAAVPFLVAAPAKTTKVQNTAPAANSNTMTSKKKVHKMHGKKSAKKTASTAPASAK